MEASGGYERRLHRHVTERGIKAAIVNPARVRRFAKASGLLAKPVLRQRTALTGGTDRLDAAAIARYGAFARPAPTPVLAGSRQALAPSCSATAASSWPRSPPAASSSAICVCRR